MPAALRRMMIHAAHAASANSRPRTVVIGGGIGGCTAAIALHKAGADVTLYESASELAEIGAGLNIQAVAIGVLADLGVTLEELTGLGDAIKTSAVQYFTSEGIFIAEEKVGVKAATTHPQLSAHRAKFHSTLVRKVQVLLGNERVHLDCALTDVQQHGEEATVHIIRTSTKEVLPPVTCDFIVGCDGLKSAVRSALYGQIQPRHTGKTLFRGICEIDRLNGDGRTVVQCGDENISFICYPISEALRKEGKFLCNWAMNVAREHPGAQENWENRTSIEHIRDELDTLSGNTFGGLLSQHAVSLFGCLSVLMSYVSVVAVCCYITAVSRCGCLGVLSSRAVCIMVLFDSRCLYCGVA